MTNRGEVYFALRGDDFDPDEATKIIGIEPTSMRRKATPRPKFSEWKFSVGEIENDVIDVYEMSSDLVGKLKKCENNILVAINTLGLEATFQVVLWISTDDSISTPAIGFEPEVISFIHKIGASVDIDTYRN
ncbi:DUF4279 domain-containing protein [Undibacterium sp.]|uniref:DUF4279 domain-containing protein n=1 Tax=Undibacterium sp. TaxID=1914977 RepID=UPI0025EA9EF6|nr:DUF4279 domain-containing protein [Undibacterium sp.]